MQKQEDWKRIEKELVYVATYASPERRDDLLRFLKGQFQTILVAEIERAKAEERERWINQPANQHDERIREAERDRIREWVQNRKKKLGMYIHLTDFINFLNASKGE